MSSIISELEQVTGASLGTGIGFGLALTAQPALTPLSTALKQTAWEADPNLAPNVFILAEGVAQGQIKLADARTWAHQQGISNDAFAALVDAANTGPALGYAYQAWRRGDLTETEFQTALRRQAIEPQWFDALKALKHDRLDLGAIATAVHRGIMDDAGLLVTPVPSGAGNVPRIPVSSLNTIAEFAAQGIDPERARVLVADTGLPLSLGEMLQLYNRNKVTATDVKVSIAESNVRNEYMDVALELSRRLLTPHEYGEAELRGVKSRAEAQAGANLSGLTDSDYVTLFEIMGRPLNVHEITTGLARGGSFGGGYGSVPEPYQDAIRRSAIRPEYADLAFHNRFTYPSAFVLRSLAQAGDLGGQAAVAKVLEEIGWKPSFAQQVSTAWTTGGTTTDPHVTKAHTTAWAAAQRSYIAEESTAADVQPIFDRLGVAAAARTEIVGTWDAVRALVRKQRSPAQIVKEFKNQVLNPATGAAYTHAEALADLLARGYSQNDATMLLET